MKEGNKSGLRFVFLFFNRDLVGFTRKFPETWMEEAGE
jgi:hypothetical protein